jgi:acetyl-CoA acetyltransferase
MTPARGGRRQAAVVGIAALPYAKDIGMTEREAGARAILAALDDAGLTPADVDGLTRFLWETTTEIEMGRTLGMDGLKMFGCVDYGGGAGPPVVALAAMAIEVGLADVMVVWRARNRGSGVRPWMKEIAAKGQDQFEWPHGLIRPVDGIAMQTRVWMERNGWPQELLGSIAINNRNYATRNPMALMRDPITMDDYLASRWICEPLRLFDCCLETDGALALVMTAADRARDLRQQPAYVTGYGFGSMPEQYLMTSYYGPNLEETSARYVGRELWKNTGLTAKDIDVVQWYDAFTPEIAVQFEEYGFCELGEAPSYLTSGEHVPYNTSGGSLSEAYVHGFNLLVEGVRQIRGASTSQVDEVAHCLVSGGNVVPTGAVVFSAEAS